MKIQKHLVLIVLLFCTFTTLSQNTNEIILLHRTFDSVLYRNFDEAYLYATEAVKKSEAIKDKKLMLISYNKLSHIYFIQKNFSASRKFAQKALILAKKQNNYNMLAILYNRLGSLYIKNDDYVQGLKHYEKVLDIATKNNLENRKCDAYINLARVYRIQDYEKKSLQTFHKSIDLAKKVNYKEGLVKSYNSIGVLYQKSNRDSSLYYYKASLKKAKETGNLYMEGVVLSNLGYVYMDMENYEESLSKLLESEKISEKMGNKSGLHYINLSLGIYYEKIDHFQKAIEKYEKAIKDYGSSVDHYQKMRAFWTVSGIYYHSGDYKQAYLYQEKHNILKDSLLNIEKTKEFEKIRTQYEVEKKNSQITLLKKDKELATVRRKWIIYCALLLLFPLVVLLFFYRHRIKTQQTIRSQEKEIHQKEKARLQQEQEVKRIQALIEGQDKEKNRIAKELHDGLGGQLAGVKLNLSNINSTLNNPKIEAVNQDISFVFKELRTLSHSLSSNYITNRNLEALLAELKQQYEATNTFTIEISMFPENCFDDISNEIKHHIYRILQELLTNVTKHAKARQVSISFTRQNDKLVVIIEDDGIGFDTKTTTKGIGLKNIEERILGLGGNLTIDILVKKGTHSIIEIPLGVETGEKREV